MLVEKIIQLFNEYGDFPIDGVQSNLHGVGKNKLKSKKASSFSVALDLLLSQKLKELTGTKIDYVEIYNSERVMEYIDFNPIAKVKRETTVLDLKLLYCLLTGERHEIKGTKDQIYEAIKGNIRAKKRGSAFARMG